MISRREIHRARTRRALHTAPLQLDGVPVQKPGSRSCAKFYWVSSLLAHLLAERLAAQFLDDNLPVVKLARQTQVNARALHGEL